jgi:prepilin-type N-terminal cleavage/methylation domain-containing protein
VATAVKQDAGFTLVEVLVALVIASILLTAVGGLVAFAGALSQRSGQQHMVLDTLSNLQTLSDQFEAWPLAWAVSDFSGAEEEANLRTEGGAEVILQLREATTSTPAALAWRGEGIVAPGQISMAGFAEAKLEYFLTRRDPPRWVGAFDQLGETPSAIRLNLTDGRRQWVPVLWAAQRTGP